MAELTINELTAKKLDRNGKVPDIIQAAASQNTTGTAVLDDITYDDTQMHGFATATQTVYTKYKATPPTATKEDVRISVDTLVDAYDINAGDIQAVARTQARLAGNVNVGINIIKKAGYLVNSPKSAMENAFDAKPDGPNAIKITTKAVAQRAVYIREWAQVSGINVIPLPGQMKERLISTENDIRVEGLETAGVYAFREATILPISRKSDSGTPTPAPEMKATKSKATKAHRRTFSAQAETNYDFGPWIWAVSL